MILDMDFHQIKISKIVASEIEAKMTITNLGFLTFLSGNDLDYLIADYQEEREDQWHNGDIQHHGQTLVPVRRS